MFLFQSSVLPFFSGADALKAGYDLPGLAASIDFFNVMTYDYYGAWKMAGRTNLPDPPPGAMTGPPSPLYSSTPLGASGVLNVDWTLKYYGCRLKNNMAQVGANDRALILNSAT